MSEQLDHVQNEIKERIRQLTRELNVALRDAEICRLRYNVFTYDERGRVRVAATYMRPTVQHGQESE